MAAYSTVMIWFILLLAKLHKIANGWEDGDFNVAQFAVKAKGVLSFDEEATLWAVYWSWFTANVTTSALNIYTGFINIIKLNGDMTIGIT